MHFRHHCTNSCQSSSDQAKQHQAKQHQAKQHQAKQHQAKHHQTKQHQASNQGLVKGAILCFRNLYFYFRHGESTSTASQKVRI